MPTITQLAKSKTLWLAVILAVLSVVQGYLGAFNLTPVNQMYAGVGLSAIITVLRFLTTTAVAEK